MGVLAFDIGGTKTLAALVDGQTVIESQRIPTRRGATPDDWLQDLAQATHPWKARYRNIGFALTGHVAEGRWSSLNDQTLAIPAQFPLFDVVSERFGSAPLLINDAQAATYGEFRHGAGQGQDIVFLTVSTGLGGGIIANGALVRGRSGLAGHFGQMRGGQAERLEDRVSGRWMMAEAQAQGVAATAKDVFDAASAGEGWADTIIEESARRVAALCADIMMMLDPARIVLGGSIGMATGYRDRVAACLDAMPGTGGTALVCAQLGEFSGIVGVAALMDQTV